MLIVFDTNTIQQSTLLLVDGKNNQSDLFCLPICSMVASGAAIYTQHRFIKTSVELEIHLSRRNHKLPLLDSSYKLLLDGREIGCGNFVKGYILKYKTSPGKHKLSAYVPLGIISTPFEFDVEQDKFYHIE